MEKIFFLLSPKHCFTENHIQRGRLASVMVDDGDGDGSTISQSVAMAIAGSPLPHTHRSTVFQMPSVVSVFDLGKWKHTVKQNLRGWRIGILHKSRVCTSHSGFEASQFPALRKFSLRDETMCILDLYLSQCLESSHTRTLYIHGSKEKIQQTDR